MFCKAPSMLLVGTMPPLSPAQKLRERLHVVGGRSLRHQVFGSVSEEGSLIESRNRTASYTGKWIKNARKSDSMGPASDVMQLNFALRQGLKIIKVMKLEETDDTFKTVLSAGPLNINECYPKSGEAREFNRRDLRRGKHTGKTMTDKLGNQMIQCTWPDPLGGRCVDTFILDNGGSSLNVNTVISLNNGNECTYTLVYDRAE